MIKRMIILIIMGLTLSSCQLFTETIKDNILRYEMKQETKERHKKSGGGAISVDKYKEGVEATIKDILKRPINKRIQFEEAILLIPENTELNKKVGNIVDMKTGYGIPIYIINDGEHCSQLAFTKRVNGFKDTCK